MKFSELRRAVKQVWQFVLPPIFNLCVLLISTYYIAPGLLPKALAALPGFDSKTLFDQQTYDSLEHLGLNKLLPLCAAIGAIFFLYVMQSLILTLGHILPGSISYDTDARFCKAAGVSRLARFWAKMPGTEDPDEAIRSMIARFEQAKPVLKKSYRYWTEQSARFTRWRNTSKVFLLWSFVLPIFAMYCRVPARSSIASAFTLCSLAACAYGFAKEVFADEQQSFAMVQGLELALASDNPPDAAVVAQRQKQLSDHLPKRFDWWKFRLIDWHFMRWIYRTFIK